jgi:hypothetical protein
METFNRFTFSLPLATQPTNRLVNITGTAFPFASQSPAFPLLSFPESFAGVFTNLLVLQLSEIPAIRVDPLPLNKAKLTWQGIPGFTNAIEALPSLPGTWQRIGATVPSTSSASFPLPNSANSAQYYRVLVE